MCSIDEAMDRGLAELERQRERDDWDAPWLDLDFKPGYIQIDGAVDMRALVTAILGSNSIQK